MYEIGDYLVEIIENETGSFFKINCSHQSIIWAAMKKGCVKEVSEYTIRFREILLTHEFTFLKHYGPFLKVYLKTKNFHFLGIEFELGITTTEVKNELDAYFAKFS